MHFFGVVLLGHTLGLFALIVDSYRDNFYTLQSLSLAPAIMAQRLPGYTLASVLSAISVSILLTFLGRQRSRPVIVALSLIGTSAGFLAWLAVTLQIGSIAGELRPNGVGPMVSFYGAVLAVLLLLGALGRLVQLGWRS